jgi:hypothetical protein
VRFGAIPTTNVEAKLRIVGKQVFFDNFDVEADGGQESDDVPGGPGLAA